MEIYFSQPGGGKVGAQGPADPGFAESHLPDFLLCPLIAERVSELWPLLLLRRTLIPS